MILVSCLFSAVHLFRVKVYCGIGNGKCQLVIGERWRARTDTTSKIIYRAGRKASQGQIKTARHVNNFGPKNKVVVKELPKEEILSYPSE